MRDADDRPSDGRFRVGRRLGDERGATPLRVALTLLGVLVGVGLFVWAVVALVDARLPSTQPSGSGEESATVGEVTRSAEPSPSVPPAIVPTAVPEPSPTPTPTVPAPPPRVTGVVVIDPGHQARQIKTPERIGPGASETKPGVSSGTSGVVTRRPESELVLEVSLKLRDELSRRGVQVVMVRTSQNVSLTNRQRAEVANRAEADLFVRVHADGSPNRDVNGVQTLVPAPNRWTRPIVRESREAGRYVQAATIATTRATDLGVTPRADLTGFNWAKVPSVLVEIGFMSNPAEDRRLSTNAYQRKLVRGMADGIVAYLRTTD